MEIKDEQYSKLKEKFLAFNGNILNNNKRLTIETIAEFYKIDLLIAKAFVLRMLDDGIVEFMSAGINEYHKMFYKEFLLKTGKKR